MGVFLAHGQPGVPDAVRRRGRHDDPGLLPARWSGRDAACPGQERAHELLDFLSVLQVDNVGVNFDPANMIMYGAGDPINAIDTLAKFIRHVHIKDGVASDSPGKTWGSEVAFGTGQVGKKLRLTRKGKFVFGHIGLLDRSGYHSLNFTSLQILAGSFQCQ